MKQKLGQILATPSFQLSMLGDLARFVIRAADRKLYRFSPQFKLMMQVEERPHYAWCMMNAAALARSLGHDRVSVIEFGVAGGNGLRFMSEYSREVKQATGVTVECYGFDTGEGMPAPEGPRDLPYWFQAQQYRMEVDALRARLPDTRLLLGNVRETVSSFVETENPAPIGAIFNDTDYWSSTRDSFMLFDSVQTHPENFLPRQFLYFDDVIGSELEMYGECNGQLHAIREFNRSQDKVAIHLNQNLLPQAHIAYRYNIYYGHLFNHPDYERYIGAERQPAIETALALK
jgi:hypothetical protein